jgi:hypothetical protein
MNRLPWPAYGRCDSSGDRKEGRQCRAKHQRQGHDMARFMNFPEDLNLPAQAQEIVSSSIPPNRHRPGVLEGLAGPPLAPDAAPAARANRAVGPA